MENKILKEFIKKLESNFHCTYKHICLGTHESCLKCSDYCLDYDDFKRIVLEIEKEVD